MDNYIGRLLDNRYEILEAIGSGGMAVVYKARCHRLNRLVALKVLKDELSQDAEFRRRFHAESQAVAMLSHPNIVSVYDVSHSDNVDYIVMELIEGITLKQYMQQKDVLNWREALHFSTQIAKALEHAHSRGIIHRDIKPHNIMILKDGTVKVADFGIARVSSSQSTLTREALGSVHYISPEQAKGSKIDYRSDLYSLGVVMYEMLTGKPPYDGETPVSVAIMHINAGAPMPRTLNPQIPIGLEQITMHAMAANLDERFETATDMLCDLDEFRRNPKLQFTGSADFVEQAPSETDGSSRTETVRAVKKSRTSAVRTAAPAGSGARFNSVALVAGIICIALALVFIGYFLYSFFFADLLHQTEDISVPGFIGKYENEINKSDYPNLQIQIGTWESSDSAPAGVVIDQTPVEGRMVKSGATVFLTVSSGLSTDSMRDLINYTAQNAKTILDNLALDLDVQIVEESHDVYVKGAVIRTVPGKDEPLTAGQRVTLYVSSGPDIKTVPVPELVGMDVENAVKILDDLKLSPYVYYVDAEEASGTVVFQSIKQMERVKEGTAINLQVSNGPEKSEETDEGAATDAGTLFTEPNVIYIPMPTREENETLTVTVLLDGELYEEMYVELVTVEEHGLPIAPDVRGIHLLTVLINGMDYLEMEYNFDTGEQVQ